MSMRVAVLASGGGTNFQALVDAARAQQVKATVVLLVASRADAPVLKRAADAGIPTAVLSPTVCGGEAEYTAQLLKVLETHNAELVVLAGHLLKVPDAVVTRFQNRMLNVHPALLPAFGGKGMYGKHVHEAVIQSGARLSGVTVHLVDAAYDHGPAVLQRAVEVLDTDTAPSLAQRIRPHEHALLVQAVGLFAQGRVEVHHGRVNIQAAPADGKIRRALLSVSDKTGIVELGQHLHALGVELLSTGGTARALREAGLPVRLVESFTGSPEMMDGRVKTLHPKVHGALLYRRDLPDHVIQAQAFGIEGIDLVAVNLYPFAKAATQHEPFSIGLMEEIDIGGPAMVRAAAKNCHSVTVLVNPADQARVLEEIRAHGNTTPATRQELAARAYQHTAAYDAMVAQTLARGVQDPFPASITLSLQRVQSLRYGENPHQQGALYLPSGQLPSFQQLHGKELSYNNLLDAQGAWEAAQEFEPPAVVVFKHVTPCGAATADTLARAWERAFACDPVCAFGGIVAVNRPLDEGMARAMGDIFLEVVVAPSFEPAALALLQKKKNVRLLTHVPADRGAPQWRSVGREWLVQTANHTLFAPEGPQWTQATSRAPTAEEALGLRFAWAVCKHVKSNAIVVTSQDQVLGLGAGQMSRVDSVQVAGIKMAQMAERGPLGTLKVAASDAFFPFPDGVHALAKLGVTAVVQPGGSVKDGEIKDAAESHGMAMVFTGIRHFRH